MKKFVVAPDSFKGTISAAEAAKIMAEQVKKRFPECSVVSLPIADGGEGTADCFLAAVPGAELIPMTVKGPFLEYLGAYYVRFGDTAVIELAQAAGITLIEGRLDPMKASPYGVGEMVLHAVKNGCRNIVLGLGGSCSNDGGVGIAAAMGAKFYDKEGNEFLPVGGTLKQIAQYHDSACRDVLKDCNVTVLCDIENPLYGENGAAYVFAPQKGADGEMVRELDEGLRHLAGLITYQRGVDVSSLPGAGAAGGCGAGIVAFLGGSLGDLGEAALAAGAGAIVCGEAGYHVCQDLCARGCAVILLGHDRSEEPFTEILMDAARRAGVDPGAVRRIDRPRLWWTAQGDTEPEGLDRR